MWVYAARYLCTLFRLYSQRNTETFFLLENKPIPIEFLIEILVYSVGFYGCCCRYFWLLLMPSSSVSRLLLFLLWLLLYAIVERSRQRSKRDRRREREIKGDIGRERKRGRERERECEGRCKFWKCPKSTKNKYYSARSWLFQLAGMCIIHTCMCEHTTSTMEIK